MKTSSLSHGIVMRNFKELENKLFSAECPENIFNELSTETNFQKEKKLKEISNQTRDLVSQTKIGKERLRKFYEHYNFFEKWAEEKIKKGTFGYETPYKLKIDFTVERLESEKLFFVLSLPKESPKELDNLIGFSGLSVKIFCGNTLKVKNERITITRNNVITATGGTKRAKNKKDYFWMMHDTRYHTHLSASDFTEGDFLEIETYEMDSLEEFITATSKEPFKVTMFLEY